ncbi:MAG TPA: EamA family transporter [Gaiellaceae bacterium]|nr:EamA family transporter [Gaiellaceae bacterium]
MGEPIIHVEGQPLDRRPALGLAMVATAAILFGINGTVSKVVLESGLTSLQLTQARSVGAALGLGLIVALTDPSRLRVTRRELPFLVAFGVTGVAFVQWFYFLSIHKLPVGIALLIEYLAPLLVALWARYVLHERVRRRVWAALVLALVGLSLIVELWSEGGSSLDGLGIAAALAACVCYAVYILTAERGVRTRDPISLSAYGFAFSALFWLVVSPVWEFPFDALDDHVSLLGNLEDSSLPVWLLVVFIVVVGTMATFGLVVSALRHVSATRVGIVAMLEPVAAAIVAWAWLGETLGTAQLVGGAIVLAGILLAQSAR